jgi:hypothetical protein
MFQPGNARLDSCAAPSLRVRDVGAPRHVGGTLNRGIVVENVHASFAAAAGIAVVVAEQQAGEMHVSCGMNIPLSLVARKLRVLLCALLAAANAADSAHVN